uniref:Uncharacterized protein n=1 Tax=Arundo donax TaxID=35708 RepID=A0A0A8Z9M7_ARUDO
MARTWLSPTTAQNDVATTSPVLSKSKNLIQ